MSDKNINPKGYLQEWCQQLGELPRYQITQIGMMFYADCLFKGNTSRGLICQNKKQAETEAARKFIEEFVDIKKELNISDELRKTIWNCQTLKEAKETADILYDVILSAISDWKYKDSGLK